MTCYLDPRSGETFPLDTPRWCGTGRAPLLLDPVEGIRPGSHDDYFTIMRRDLATLRTALGCS